MTKRAKIALEISEKREKLNNLLGQESLTDDQRSEMQTLTKRLQELEPELRAAIVEEETRETTTGDNQTPEQREYNRLRDQASIGNIFTAALEQRQTQGPEQEIQSHHSLAANQVPLDLLEVRAVTPAPDNVGQQQQPIIPGVFPDAAAPFLGIDSPRVAVGDAVFPVLTTSAIVHSPNEGAAADETTGAFSAEVLTPKRLQASFFYSREDRARFAGMDSALRENLNMALGDALDAQVLAGTNGLFTGNNLTAHNANAQTDHAAYVSQLLFGRVDGRYASQASAIRILMGSATYTHAATIYRNVAGGANRSALMDLMADSGGVRVSAHVPAPSNTHKQNALVRLGNRRDMVAPIWEGITIIPDEVTKADTGEIKITAVMLHAVKILRTGGFYKQQTQHQ